MYVCVCVLTLPAWQVGICLGVCVPGCLNRKLLHNCNLSDLVDLVTRHPILNFKKCSLCSYRDQVQLSFIITHPLTRKVRGVQEPLHVRLSSHKCKYDKCGLFFQFRSHIYL